MLAVLLLSISFVPAEHLSNVWLSDHAVYWQHTNHEFSVSNPLRRDLVLSIVSERPCTEQPTVPSAGAGEEDQVVT